MANKHELNLVLENLSDTSHKVSRFIMNIARAKKCALNSYIMF